MVCLPTIRETAPKSEGEFMNRYIKTGFAGVFLIFLMLFPIGRETSPALIEVEVKGVRLDVIGEAPIVLLAEKGGKRILPIWIGLLEANAIDQELKNIKSKRPMTHDLLYSILGNVRAKVKEVRITELKDRTYYATLFFLFNKSLIEVDARPSDAIVIALKSKAQIFVSAKILEEQGLSITPRDVFGERHGIRIQELTPSLSFHFNFKGQKGVLVSEVISGSISEASGIKAGDIITRINSKEVGGVEEFEKAFDAVKVGSPTQILLFRENKFQEVNLLPRS